LNESLHEQGSSTTLDKTDLNQYVTEKATAALFKEIEQEENLIRKDPVQRTTELLKKAFDYADKNQK
jgi:ABC-type transporter MlaC component